jgi:8-oxo-dGTP pyrophosphatase MutT (NUDIX family)
MREPFDAAQDLKDAPDVGAKLRPKDAATLIVMRKDGPEPRVLMGRRAKGHVFMAEKWVFPGGRVDASDHRAPYATDLKPQTAAMLQRAATPARARALALAAVRELYEETGILLARAAPPRSGSGPWRDFLEAGALPDLASLDYIARAVTPPGRPRRFDARFFLADASALMSLEPRSGDRELDEIDWIGLSRLPDLDLPQITRFVVSEAMERLKDPNRPVPFARMVRGKHVVDRHPLR